MTGFPKASTRFIRFAVFLNVLILPGIGSAQDGSSGWTRTSNPPVNSCRLPTFLP